MMAGVIAAAANHLWQSTIFAGAAALLALGFRKQRAGIRYWIWMAASLKFLIPFAVLIDIGAHISWSATPPAARPYVAIAAQEIGSPFVGQRLVAPSTPVSPRDTGVAELITFAIWISGAGVVMFSWARQWWWVRRIIRSGKPLPLNAPIRAISVAAHVEPGVVGIFRPILILPEGIIGRLAPDQMQAILVHERCHIRRRDNLDAFLHMVVESVFWFHPLVWWIESRLIEERERACDEEVVSLTSDREAYAESILNVCRFYAASPSRCVSSVTGAELRKRIEDIMKDNVFEPFSASRKVLLGLAGILALAVPLFVGIATTPQLRAQSQSAPVAFEASSVKLSKNPDPRSIRMQFLPSGRLSTAGAPIRWLIATAYSMPIQSTRIVTTPEFDAAIAAMAPAQFDIEAVTPKDAIPAGATDAVRTEISRRMLQTLLAERFKLVARRETKELPVYAIVIGKNGSKLKRSDVQERDCESRSGKDDVVPCHVFNGGRGRGLHGDAVTMMDLAQGIENWAERPVLDKTGLTGLFNIQTTGWRPQNPVSLQSRPDGAPPSAEQLAFADPSTPTLFDIFELLGLRLEAQKAPVDTITLVSIDRPTEN